MGQPFDEILANYKAVINRHIEHYLTVKKPFTLYEPMRYASSTGGKQLRPILVLLGCEAVGSSWERALSAAVALELVHNFSLVHDDIMDHDELRRGRKTVHKKWDENVAILAGDALLVMAYAILAQTQTPHLQRIFAEFSLGILRVCEGQALDKEFESRETVQLVEYWEMIDKKTAELFSVACALGGLIGDGTEQHIAALKKFGCRLGRAFQIQDDLLDIFANETVLGKDIGSDLQENKKTFLILHALEQGAQDDQKFLKNLLGKNPITADDLEAAMHIFERAGTVQSAQDLLRQNFKDAREALDHLPKSAARDLLFYLTLQIEQRSS